MPLGFERLNERTQRPNPCINFIKPLTSATSEDQKIAKNFLERIAAQCYPIMKKDYLSVMALEEYEANPEFLGRNFNAGEVIQLVLKDKSGRWLSFKFVQMVMMHELAHCKQMNHSRYFWKERNRFAEHMEGLWAAGYKGEGLWGRGHDLTTGGLVPDRMPEDVDIPEHLCGGTYRRGRRGKKKRGGTGAEKPKLSYAERQQKRIAKKFGGHGDGQSLGEDDLVRGALEQGGKRHYGKPRVANSKRGRELRASAALARFDALKAHTPEKTPELEDDNGSETDSADDDDEYADGLNIFSTLERIKDQRGRELYKVCGDEGEEDEGGQAEMNELHRIRMDQTGNASRTGQKRSAAKVPTKRQYEDSETESEVDDAAMTKGSKRQHEDSETESEAEHVHVPKAPRTTATALHATNSVTQQHKNQAVVALPDSSSVPVQESLLNGAPADLEPAITSAVEFTSAEKMLRCPICSLENDPGCSTCMACSHVLKPSLMRNSWRCKSTACEGSKYINAGDAGRCGVCGAQKPAPVAAPMGVINADILRWD